MIIKKSSLMTPERCALSKLKNRELEKSVSFADVESLNGYKCKFLLLLNSATESDQIQRTMNMFNSRSKIIKKGNRVRKAIEMAFILSSVFFY